MIDDVIEARCYRADRGAINSQANTQLGSNWHVRHADHEGLCQLQTFLTDEDLRGRNVLHANYCLATCSLEN